uniref:C-type lectin domain-containing protein n=1 Tax=Cyprinus carpio TaxID=7962 RepID=A0A8C2DFM5_CYPCA
EQFVSQPMEDRGNCLRKHNVEMDRGERVEMVVAIYDSADTVRHHDLRTHTERRQPLQHTGSNEIYVKNRKHRAAEVCLCLLCVLLLTAVIVCVCFTSERKQLLTQISNLTEEREKTLAKYEQVLNNNNNLTEEHKQILSKYEQILNQERQQIFTNNIKLIAEKEHLLKENKIMTEEREQIKKTYQQEDPFKWIYYNFSFYYISSERKSWSDSSRDCQQRGTDLVIINSSKEQIAVSDQFWIGLGKMEGEWKWIGGTIMANGLLHCCFRYWSSHYLHSYGSYCVLMTSSGWIADRCDSNKKWICKRRILK